MKTAPVRNERLSTDCGGITLAGELWYRQEAGIPLVILCHGVPLSKPDPADGGYPLLARRICEKGYAVLFFNLRGTGASGGDFHIGGWYEDLRAVMRLAREELSGRFTSVYLAGFSAGGALAVKYAAEHGGVEGVATFAAPADFSEIFPREHLLSFIGVARDAGIIRSPDFPTDPDRFYAEMLECAPVEFIPKVSPVPVLLVHGGADELVPVEHMKRLYEAAGHPKEYCLLPRGSHRLRQDPRSVESLLEWLERLEHG